MQAALGLAEQGLPPGGAVLLSPGAPSYGGFRDHVERAEVFAGAAGFDPASIGRLSGLGIG
jgi:UDP-N-acetylmuramoylalanine--D-glutamate ligase